MRTIAVCVALLLASRAAAAQDRTGVVRGTVVSEQTDEPLPFSIVFIETLGRERFTDDSGRFVFGELPPGAHRIGVRRLGFQPAHVDMYARAGSHDTVRVRMAPIAVRLADIVVREHPPCTQPGLPAGDADATLRTVLSQLMMNAEQYWVLLRTHPFTYVVRSVTSRKLSKGDSIAIDGARMFAIDPGQAEAYQPGRIVKRRGRAYFFRIPGLGDFADSAFIASHCFHYAGLEGLNELDLIRIDVLAAESIDGADVNGSIYLDPANFQIRRSVLRLSRPLRQVPDVVEMEVATDYVEAVPSIPVIGNVASVQKMKPSRRRDYTVGFEHQRLVGIEWKRGQPGENQPR
ncbi:MAG: carboxypeptidase regulatory-like domain-containing protein [Gemmatimonadaceae bacterium]